MRDQYHVVDLDMSPVDILSPDRTLELFISEFSLGCSSKVLSGNGFMSGGYYIGVDAAQSATKQLKQSNSPSPSCL